MEAPNNKMSPQYQEAMWNALLVTEPMIPGLLEHRGLTPEQGERLLNANWNLYLAALAECDMGEARETYSFIELVETHLRLSEYTVEFSASGRYCVYEGETKWQEISEQKP